MQHSRTWKIDKLHEAYQIDGGHSNHEKPGAETPAGWHPHHRHDGSGVRIGPYCTQILADLGADVIKVEPAEGDSVRNIGLPPKTPPWDRCTCGSTEASGAGKRAIRHRARSTVWEVVKKLRPDIVYVHCTGFGLHGPYAGLQAYDDFVATDSRHPVYR